MRNSDIKERKTFTINENIYIVCRWIKNRNGFKHDATYYENGDNWGTVKVCYYNRTWESFEYETVLKSCLRAYSHFTEEEQKAIIDCFQKRDTDELNRRFGFIAGIAKLGEILCDTPKEKNDWKLRMVKAGLGEGLIVPEDWDTLTEEEKERRINGVLDNLKV
jgi:hypothetical protein